MTQRAVTAEEVARLAGVSQSAVSRTYTPGASVAAKTREKVLAAARQLGYRPNAMARTLITNRSRIIGVVMAYLDNMLYPDVLEKLAAGLQERGYQMLLFTGFKDRHSDPVFEQIMQYRVDGLLLASTTLSSDLSDECTAAGVPVVMFNRTTEHPLCCSVTSDNRNGGRQIAEFLFAGGHRRFAYIAGAAISSTNRDREAGFREGLRRHGVLRDRLWRGQSRHGGHKDGGAQSPCLGRSARRRIRRQRSHGARRHGDRPPRVRVARARRRFHRRLRRRQRGGLAELSR